MEDVRRCAAVKRRLSTLQQESSTNQRVLEVTDWSHRDSPNELQAHTLVSNSVNDEIADIEFLLDFYYRTANKQSSLVITPYTAALISVIVLLVFVIMTLTAGALSGAVYVH